MASPPPNLSGEENDAVGGSQEGVSLVRKRSLPVGVEEEEEEDGGNNLNDDAPTMTHAAQEANGKGIQDPASSPALKKVRFLQQEDEQQQHKDEQEMHCGEEKQESDALPSWMFDSPVCLGVDEAGRGPVLGPMVYGACVCPADEQSRLRKVGYDDSKALTEEKRSSLFAAMQADERVHTTTTVISARELSAQMTRPEKVSLNAISFDACFRLIEGYLDKGVNVTEVYVDTVGDPGRYTAVLSKRFPGVKCVAEAKADAKYPVVSAASIAAKVTRDRELVNFAFEEPFEQEAMRAVPEGVPEAVRKAAIASVMPSRAFGSGYPGDPATKAWLDSTAKDPVFGYPSIVRFSWQTVRKLFDDSPFVPMRFAADDDDDDAATDANAIGSLWGQPLKGERSVGKAGASSGRGRAKFFQARKIACAAW